MSGDFEAARQQIDYIYAVARTDPTTLRVVIFYLKTLDLAADFLVRDDGLCDLQAHHLAAIMSKHYRLVCSRLDETGFQQLTVTKADMQTKATAVLAGKVKQMSAMKEGVGQQLSVTTAEGFYYGHSNEADTNLFDFTKSTEFWHFNETIVGVVYGGSKSNVVFGNRFVYWNVGSDDFGQFLLQDGEHIQQVAVLPDRSVLAITESHAIRFTVSEKKAARAYYGR